jgi:hypothetical protein
MKQLTSTQQIGYTINPTDRKGHPAQLDGVPVWASSNEAVATVVPAADGLSATVVAGVPGDCVISVTADADLGEGVVNLAGTEEIVVVPAAAVTISLTAGEIVEQPDTV